MRIWMLIFLLVFGPNSCSWAARRTEYGAPNGSGGNSLLFCGGFDALYTYIPATDLTSYSMSFWLSPGPTDFSIDRSFFGQRHLGINYGFWQNDESTGQFDRLNQSHWGSDNRGSTVVPSGPASDPANWLHAMFTYDSETQEAKIFYNGVSDDGGGAIVDAPTVLEAGLILGGRNGGDGNGYIGEMDDVAFWDHVIPPSEIAAIASGTLPTDLDDPAQLFYDFNEELFSDQATSSAVGSGIWGVPADHAVWFPLGAPPLPPLEEPQAQVAGNWNTRLIRLSAEDALIQDTAESRALVAFADGGANTNGWAIAEDATDTRDRIDMARANIVPERCYTRTFGDYASDHRYPDGTGGDSRVIGGSNFVVHASTESPLVFPEGTYAIRLKVIGGGDLRIVPVDGSDFSFTSEHRTRSDEGVDDTLTNDREDRRLPPIWSCGEFTVGAEGLEAHIDSIMYRPRSSGYLVDERGNYEISIGNGSCTDPVDFGDQTLKGQGEANSGGATDGIWLAGTDRASMCDLNGDGVCDIADMDLVATPWPVHFSTPTIAGIETWLSQASSAPGSLQLVMGDIDLNGEVDSEDLGLLLNSFSKFGSWGQGNLNLIDRVDSTDLGLLLNNYGFKSPELVVVPEPDASVFAWLVAFVFAFRKRKR